MAKTRAADNRLVGLETSEPHGAVDAGFTPEPDWTHAPRDGVDGTKDNYFAIDAAGNMQWATESEVDAAKLEHVKRGAAYNRRLDDIAIDARALLDGRIPAGWTTDQPTPEAALAFGPNSTYAAVFAAACEADPSFLEKVP